jgi:opine dehydrogenase
MKEFVMTLRNGTPVWAVIGGGNGGQSASGHLGIMGYRVRLYDIIEETINAVNARGGIEVSGEITGFGPVEFASGDLAKVIQGADIVMVITPALAHRELAEAMAKFLREGQIVFIHPGATFGALEFRQVFLQKGVDLKGITLCEAQSLIYACRASAPASASIKGIKRQLAVAALPAARTDDTVKVLSAAFPQIVPARNVLETSLTNLNAVMHPAPSLLNASMIESNRDWKYYLDGITPTIGAFIEKLDKERVALGTAAGLSLPTALEMYKAMYGVEAPTLSETVKLNKAYWEIQGQKRIDTRYILEDIPMGLVPMVSLAEIFGIKTEFMTTVCRLGSQLLDRDLISSGRTMERLGLGGFSKKEILDLVENG